MDNRPYALGIIRVSSIKQGLQGDSPEDQLKQIELFANSKNLHLENSIEFWESAGGEKQPVLKVLQYCKEHKIQFVIFKSIDRFTRGGSRHFENLIYELNKIGVTALDSLGIISMHTVNTLAHLDVEYDWSVFRPTKKLELMEAERASDDRRDILTRLIGAEVKYSRLGYWTGGSINFGYTTERIDTGHGKRWVIVPLENESKYILIIFNRKTEGKLTDQQIVDEVNNLGYISRVTKMRHPDNNMKNVIIGYKGGKKLDIKQMYKYLENPIYCGVLIKKWKGKTNPVMFAGKAIITTELFNLANKGKKSVFIDNGGKPFVARGEIPNWQLFKQKFNPLYPYKEVVLCSVCKKPLHASGSRGKMGKHYPAYHCGRNHKLFRIPLDEFNETIETFVKNVKFDEEKIMELKEEYLAELERRRENALGGSMMVDKKIAEIKGKQFELGETIKILKNPDLIRKMEEDYGKLELELGLLAANRNKHEQEKANLQEAINSFWYYLEHLDELILWADNPIQSAKMFGLLFEEKPTYEDLVVGTPKLARIFKLKQKQNLSVSRQRLEL